MLLDCTVLLTLTWALSHVVPCVLLFKLWHGLWIHWLHWERRRCGVWFWGECCMFFSMLHVMVMLVWEITLWICVSDFGRTSKSCLRSRTVSLMSAWQCTEWAGLCCWTNSTFKSYLWDHHRWVHPLALVQSFPKWGVHGGGGCSMNEWK